MTVQASTSYAGSYIYKDNLLEMIFQPEGYLEPDGNGGFKYAFQYKDHLGNVRLSYSDLDLNGAIDSSTEILDENNYYPFGLQQKGYNNAISSNSNSVANNFGYNGKENNPELGIEWMDFGARNYDASLGRWMNIDPLAELMTRHSPYNFAFDNPIFFIDPDGMAPVASQDDTVIIRDDCGGTCDENSEPTASIQDFLDVLNTSLDGFHEVSVSDDGELLINKTDKEGEASEGSNNLAKILTGLIDDKGTVEVSITQDSDDVLAGSFALEAIDISDVKKFETSDVMSPAGVLAHELVEQFSKQVGGMSEYKDAHKTGNAAGNLVDGVRRNTRGERSRGNNTLIVPFNKKGQSGTFNVEIIVNPANIGEVLEVKQIPKKRSKS